jgi:predicted dithiol-disulfide oxidoreductase (DUF899 family)
VTAPRVNDKRIDADAAEPQRFSQTDIERVKARMGWQMPWYTLTDDFDIDFGVDGWHGTNAFIRLTDQAGERVFRSYFINNRGCRPFLKTDPWRFPEN